MISKDWQFELGDITMGDGTDYLVYAFNHGGPEVTHSDVQMPRGDGVRFGRDYFGGSTLTMEIEVDGATATAGLNNLAVLRKAWYGDTVRHDPGSVDVLKYRMPGRDTRRVYGRGRKFTVVELDNTNVGITPVVAEFLCADHRIYADTEDSHTISIAPSSAGGLVFPLNFPASASGTGTAEGDVEVAGDDATWLVMTITGPIVNPVVDVLNFWKVTLNTTLLEGQSVTIDPRPWVRTVRRNDGTNLAGVFSSSTPRLSGMAVTPGSHEIVLRGTSSSGTASLTVQWRPAYLSL